MAGTDIGTGATLTFATSSFTMEITDMSWGSIERAAIDVSHLGTTTARAFLPGDLYDPGDLTVNGHWNMDDIAPLTNTAETITLAAPLTGTETTASKWAAAGFVTGFSGSVPLEDKMTGSLTVKFTGAITQSDSA